RMVSQRGRMKWPMGRSADRIPDTPHLGVMGFDDRYQSFPGRSAVAASRAVIEWAVRGLPDARAGFAAGGCGALLLSGRLLWRNSLVGKLPLVLTMLLDPISCPWRPPKPIGRLLVICVPDTASWSGPDHSATGPKSGGMEKPYAASA